MQEEFATCYLVFTELESESVDNLAYGHFHTSVIVDSRQELARIIDVQPKKTPTEAKVSSPSKKCWTVGGTGSVGAIFTQPKVSVGVNASRVAETSTSSERTMNTFRITTLGMDGFASWGYHISDDFQQVGGKALLSDELPRARFRFVGKTSTPTSPPDRLDVEVLTYWSVLRCYGGTEEIPKRWPWKKRPFIRIFAK